MYLANNKASQAISDQIFEVLDLLMEPISHKIWFYVSVSQPETLDDRTCTRLLTVFSERLSDIVHKSDAQRNEK